MLHPLNDDRVMPVVKIREPDIDLLGHLIHDLVRSIARKETTENHEHVVFQIWPPGLLGSIQPTKNLLRGFPSLLVTLLHEHSHDLNHFWTEVLLKVGFNTFARNLTDGFAEAVFCNIPNFFHCKAKSKTFT